MGKTESIIVFIVGLTLLIVSLLIENGIALSISSGLIILNGYLGVSGNIHKTTHPQRQQSRPSIPPLRHTIRPPGQRRVTPPSRIPITKKSDDEWEDISDEMEDIIKK